MEIAEKFSWMSPEFKTVDSGKNTIRIKGIALKGNVVSRNNRKYVDEELKKAARSWIGKPVTINHDDNRKVGNVTWMEYDDDGFLEYIADINKQPYVTMLREKSTDIKGVSVQANYLHNRCPKCGDRFYTEEDFASHMWTRHFIKTDPTREPHGLVGQALSLVLAPEEPGFPDTTIELMETKQEPSLQLLETVIKTKIEEEDYMAKISGKAAVSQEPRIPWDKTKTVKEQEVHTCPDGEHWSESEGKCVPNAVQEQEEPLKTECPEGFHKDEEGVCVPDEQPATVEVPTVPVEIYKPLPNLEMKLPKPLKLGEPFGGYDDFADCVAKNQDKDDPEAYCGFVKHKTEGETVKPLTTSENIYETQKNLASELAKIETATYIRDIKAAEQINKLGEAVAEIFPKFKATLDKVAKQINEFIVASNKKVLEVKANMPKEDTAWKKDVTEKLGKVSENLQQYKTDYDQTFKDIDTKVVDFQTTTETQLKDEIKKKDEELAKVKEELAKLQEKTDKKLEETQDLTTRVENLEDKQKPTFRAKSKKPDETVTHEYVEDPLKKPQKAR